MNAAFWQQVLVESWDSALVRRHFDTNVMGLVHGIEAVLPSMRRRGAGTIVGMASLAGYRGFPRSEGYGPTKAAMINMLEALRIDLQPPGIDGDHRLPRIRAHRPDLRTTASRCRSCSRPTTPPGGSSAASTGARPRSRFRCRWRWASRPCGLVPARPYAWAVGRLNQR